MKLITQMTYIIKVKLSVEAFVQLSADFYHQGETQSVQSWQLTETQIQRLAVVWNRMVRHMVRGGFAKRVSARNGSDFALRISIEQLFKIARLPSLPQYIKRQQLQFAAHISRMRNDSWQKRTMFMQSEIGGGKSDMRRYCDDMGGLESSQILKRFQNRKEFRHELDVRFGHRDKRSAKNRRNGEAHK